MSQLEDINLFLYNTNKDLQNIQENLQNLQNLQNLAQIPNHHGAGSDSTLTQTDTIGENISTIISLIKKIENYLKEAKKPNAKWIYIDRGW